MRLMNADLSLVRQGYPRFIPGKPEVKRLDIHDKTFFLDVNSLVCLEAETAHEVETFERQPASVDRASLLWWPYRPSYTLAAISPKPRNIVLGITNRCNLACEYCFVRNYRIDQFHDMSSAIISKVVKEFLGPGVTVGFFGGEPTMVWNEVLFAVDLVERTRKEKGWPAQKFSMTTNAVLIDDAKAKYLNEHNFSLIVSLDGPHEIHNASRPARNSSVDSWKATMRGLACLAKYPIAKRITLRSTYTAQSVHLVERLKIHQELIAKGIGGHSSVEPVSLNEVQCLRLEDKHGLSMQESERGVIKDEYHQAGLWWVDQVKAGKRPRWHHFYKSHERIMWQIHSPTECGAGNGYVTVGADGTLYACHREGKSNIGHLDYGFDEERRSLWMDNRWYRRRGCSGCWRRNLCGGGCRMDSIDRTDDTRLPDNCWLRQTFFLEALWALSMVGGPEAVYEWVRNPREQRRRRSVPQKRQQQRGEQCQDQSQQRNVPPQGGPSAGK